MKKVSELIDIFGQSSVKVLINSFKYKFPSQNDNSNEIICYIEKQNKVIVSTIVDKDSFPEHIEREINTLQNNLDSTTIVSEELWQILLNLGTKAFGQEANQQRVNNFENDFWFVRLRDLLKQEVSTSRKRFMKVAAYWYVLIELEDYSEEEVVNVLAQDGFKMKEIMEKWNVDNFANFMERVHYIASTKQIEHFLKIIKRSSASNESKEEIIDELLNSDVIDTW